MLWFLYKDSLPRNLSTAEFFRRIGVKGWRKSAYFTFTSRYPVLRRWLIAQLIKRDKDVLSIGCGSGELESALAESGRRVFGVDLCYELLVRARRRGLRNLVQADGLKLPFVDSSFDLVIFPESIGYFAVDEVLSSVSRVLKPRGRIQIAAYATNFASDDIYKKTPAQDLAGELESGGFRILDHKLLGVKKSRVIEVSGRTRPEIIYILAQRRNSSSAHG